MFQHSKISTGERWIWRKPGFSPSEPIFVREPGKTDSLEGVIISVASPVDVNSTEKAFVLILEPEDLSEIARIYFEEDVKIALGFHGIFVPFQ